DPADFELLPIEDAGLNRAAIKVRHELVFPDTTANPPPLVREYAGARFVSNCYQVAWPAVYGDVEFRTGKSGPFNNRLEICRQQSSRLAWSRNTYRLETLLEEDASGIRILRS